MAKSDKATTSRRVQDVLRVMLAGGEFNEIRQFASDQGWQVSERQLRRYIETANTQLAEAAQRDRGQLLGRHLMQRRALYARCLKANDLRTALQVLRDEAELFGLYPPTKIAATTPDGQALSMEDRQLHINAILVQRFGPEASLPAPVLETEVIDHGSRTSSPDAREPIGPRALTSEPTDGTGWSGDPAEAAASPAGGISPLEL